MAVQIANPEVVRKIEWLAANLNTSKTAAVERALDAFVIQVGANKSISALPKDDGFKEHMSRILAEFDKLPRSDGPSDLDWDENGLPI